MISQELKLVKLLSQSVNQTLAFDELKTLLKIDTSGLDNLLSKVSALGVGVALKNQQISLLDTIEFLDQAYIYQNVKGRGRIEVVDCIDSTNSELLRRASNLACGDCLIAEYQSAARGRRERKWQGALGRQVTLSLCWEFVSLESFKLLSIGVGIEIAKSLEKYGFVDIKVKWPNDLFYKEGKLGGILIETLPKQKGVSAIIGVGINLKSISLVNEERSCSCLLQSGNLITRNELAVLVINALHVACKKISSYQGSEYIQQLSKRDYLFGKKVKFVDGLDTYEGVVVGINHLGELLLKSVAGHIFNLKAGEFLLVS